jgi:Glycosyl hydrolases family 43
MPEVSIEHIDFEDLNRRAISQPLVKHIYTADPSAHVFNGKIYIYPSHDIEAGIPFDDLGSHFAMEDYHVISMDSVSSEAVDNGVALHVKDVPWAERQMWAPDAAHKNGKYYLYFPAKKADDIFQIGVAVADSPTGPFVAEILPIEGSYSIDPAVFEDKDGSFYMYFGGLWGGQLQSYRHNQYSTHNQEPAANEIALYPLIAKLTEDMLGFAEAPKEVIILDENGNSILAGDTEKRFFEASWMHFYQGKYYFSYSTGDTHLLCYATGDNPYGPFTYQGRILNPVVGWTTHHSICEVDGKWYLFYHDSSLSEGITHLRSVKFTEITYDANGKIQTIEPYR